MRKGTIMLVLKFPEKLRRIFGRLVKSARDIKNNQLVYKDDNYLLDTHTAVAVDVYDKYVITTGDLTPTVVVSTASPFKFNNSVCKALFAEDEVEGKSEFELLNLLSKKTGWSIPEGLKNLDKKTVLHDSVCEKNDMKDVVRKSF